MRSSSLLLSSNLFLFNSLGLFSSLLLSSSLFLFSIPGLFSSLMLFSPQVLKQILLRTLALVPGLSSSLFVV